MVREELYARAGMRVFERGWLSSNNILFMPDGSAETASQAVMVDTGYATHAEQTVALVRNALGKRPLDRIVNTHLHSDHCGGNFALQQAFGCQVDVPVDEAAKVDAWDDEALSYVATGQQCPRFVRTGVIAVGDRLRLGRSTWTALAAPGHDPHSVVLHEPELQLLISADALWANGFGVVFPELVGEPGFDDVEATLQMLSELSVRLVIPGHGAPFEDFEPALERAFKRIRSLKSDPVRHAQHAAKVLIKFHMLEIQQCSLQTLEQWLDRVPYIGMTHRAHFARTDARHWQRELLQELCASGALAIDGDTVRDC
jgi:glyoxylase-like metal-dependent hydrolase (beta-lactamase superfamily II)